MSRFRSYFNKNNTIIFNNLSNSGLNPVTEISYGTYNKQPSRFIFDVDLTQLQDKISNNSINSSRIVSHTLHLINTIRYAQEYIGKKSYSLGIQRASSFNLEFFNIDQDWDGGSGYDLEYNDTLFPNIVDGASNWYERKTDTLWDNEGIYNSGTTSIIGIQTFTSGAENISLDVTDYINQRLFTTGYTGTTIYTGTSYGVGIKFPDNLEDIVSELRYAVAFHTKNTNTWYEPYIETIVDDIISDDRNYFYLDKENDIYLYVNIGNNLDQEIIIDSVNIYDYEDNLIDTITGNSIINVSKGVYKISLFIDSIEYPDAVIFKDEWNIRINNGETQFNGEFYLISQDNYYAFNNANQINFNNYHFYFWGIDENETITAGITKKIKLTIKELYSNQNNFLPLDLEYRLFTTISDKYEVDIIPSTKINHTNVGYEFDLDTSWLIPQDYKLQIRMKNGNYYENKETLSFTIVSNNLI